MAATDTWFRDAVLYGLCAVAAVYGYKRFVAHRLLTFGLNKKFSAWLLSKIMWRIHARCANEKSLLFKEFDKLCTHYDESGPHILEIGVGPGNNQVHFPRPCRMSCIEPNPECQKYLKQALKEFPGVKLVQFVKGFAEDMSEFEDNTFDAVVCTFTLCSIQNPDQALQEIKRVLKPGGLFFFMEHVAAPASSWLRKVQNWLNVVWPWVTEGCHHSHETWRLVQNAGFSSTTLTHFSIKRRFINFKTGVYGTAKK